MKISDLAFRAFLVVMIIIIVVIVSAYRYIAITNMPIIPVFVEYLGQFLIDFNQL